MNKSKYLKGPCGHCRSNIEFPVELVGTTIDCPHCGKPTELLLAAPPPESSIPRMAVVWTSVAVLILAAGLVVSFSALKRAERWAARQKGQAAATNTAAPAAVEPPTVPLAETNWIAATNNFQISAITLEKTHGTSLVYATGALTNPTDRQRFGVKIELDLLDAAGNKLGTAKDYTKVIEPNAEWHFRALAVASKAADARLASIKEDQ